MTSLLLFITNYAGNRLMVLQSAKNPLPFVVALLKLTYYIFAVEIFSLSHQNFWLHKNKIGMVS